MNLNQRKLPIAGVSLLASSVLFAFAGPAAARNIDVTGNLTNVTGAVQTGSAVPGDARGNVTALLDFTVPAGEFGADATDLAGSNSAVDFGTSLNGTIETGGVFGDLASSLSASNVFADGAALAGFLTGTSGLVTFDSATISSDPIANATISDATAQILNATFGGDGSQTLANLASGTLDLAGNQGALALNIDGAFVDGDGSVDASGTVADAGNDNDDDNNNNGGGAVSVPGPSGLGMALFGLGLIGAGAATKRRQS